MAPRKTNVQPRCAQLADAGEQPLLGPLPAGVLGAVGEDDDELVGVVAAVALGAVEEQPDGVVQRRHAARFEATGDRADGAERRGVDEDVVRIVVVELDDGDGRFAAGGTLTGEEAVEP